GLVRPLYLIMDVRAITPRLLILESVAISSSVMPSEKYSSLGLGLMFANGRTAIRFLSSCVDGEILSSCQGSATLYSSTGAPTFLRVLAPRLVSGSSNLFWTWS